MSNVEYLKFYLTTSVAGANFIAVTTFEYLKIKTVYNFAEKECGIKKFYLRKIESEFNSNSF